MSDQHLYMIFGASIALAGFWLAATARSGEGRTIIKIFGAEMTLAAAGGIVVMFLGILTFALPLALQIARPPAVEGASAKSATKDRPANDQPHGDALANAATATSSTAAATGADRSASSESSNSEPAEQIGTLQEKIAAQAGEIKELKEKLENIRNFVWVGTPNSTCDNILDSFAKSKGAHNVNKIGSGDGVFFDAAGVDYGVVCRKGHLVGTVYTPDKDMYISGRDWLRGQLDKYSTPE